MIRTSKRNGWCTVNVYQPVKFTQHGVDPAHFTITEIGRGNYSALLYKKKHVKNKNNEYYCKMFIFLYYPC